MPHKRKYDSVERALRGLDLGENEAMLYTELLGRSPISVQKLTMVTPFPRTMLYYVLNQLIRRGLVSARKKGAKTVYGAENPDRLRDLLTRKQKEFERGASAVRELIPRLKDRYRLANARPTVRIFDGFEEYQNALEDLFLSQPDVVRSYETLSGTKPALEARDTHDRKRVVRKIRKNVLFFEERDAMSNLKARRYDDYTQFRSIKAEAVEPFSADLALYGGKLLYTSYADPHEPTAVLIEDQVLFEMQTNLFEALWKQGRDRTLAYIEKP